LRCSEFKPDDDYHRSSRRAGWRDSAGVYRQSRCKRCQSDDRIRHGRDRAAWVGRIKVESGCSRCGYNKHSEALDFHHIGPKSISVSTAALAGASLRRIMKEIKQCIVLCANCHRVEHAEQRRVSFVGNRQHNGDCPLRWDRSKSTDEADALMRHFVERGTIDSDGTRHTSKVAWRALAMLQKELEAARDTGGTQPK
jgi:hypothetical protein